VTAWKICHTPGYGAPQWFKIPFSNEQWISIPNQERLDKLKYLWLQVQWDNEPLVPPNPVAWAPQGFAITGGTRHVDHLSNQARALFGAGLFSAPGANGCL
jgi:hypothetical protein